MAASSYGVFLKTFDRETRSLPHKKAALAGQQTDRLAVLKKLQDEGEPVEVQQLLKASDLGVLGLAETLQTMQRSGLVTLMGAGEAEMVKLTPEGAQLAESL